MVPALLAMSVASTPVLAVLIMAIILFGFQTAIGNVQTLPSDLYSNKAVGSLAGYAGTAAKFAAAGLVWVVPLITKTSYMPAFIIGVALAVLAVLSVFILIPKIEPLKPRGAKA